MSEINECIDFLNDNGYKCFPNSVNGGRDALLFATSILTADSVLDQVGDQDIIDHLHADGYFIASDEHEAVEVLTDKDMLYPPGKKGPSLYRPECIVLIDQLVRKHGWDFVYALLEPHKVL